MTAPASKGAPTPKRSAQVAARKRPLVPEDRKAFKALVDGIDATTEAGQRMLALVNDLLEVSKLESTVGTFHLERIDLRGLVRPVVQELEPLLTRNQQAMHVQMSDLPLVAKVDPLRLQQVIRNVLANAINPKVVLFFLSFLPQFVQPAQGHVPLQIGLLGLLFTLQAAVLFGLLGYFAGTVGGWLQRRPGAGLWLDRVAGVLFVGLGLRLISGR